MNPIVTDPANYQTKTGFENKTNFGFDEIAVEDKQNKVNDVFDSVSTRYDLMNDLLSGGMHRLWKDAFVSWLSPPKRENSNWNLLDVAGGTGDIALRILDRTRVNLNITVSDISQSMLQICQRRATATKFAKNLKFVLSNAEDIPFENFQFDAFTIGFGIRNVTCIDKVLSEAFRVLKPGGRFLCLEFSETAVPILDKIYDLYSFNVMPWIGQLVVNDGAAYRYLAESIRKFPSQEQFTTLIEQAGFSRVTYRNFSGGIVAIHSGWKT